MSQPTQFGKYLLLERIAAGGMAEVFRAKAFGVEGFERLVAVKRILPAMAAGVAGAEFVQMFIDEAKIAVQLSHANVAQVFDLGEVDGQYYIALEHVFGRDVRSVFDRCRKVGQGPMPVSHASFIVMKMCEGLDYAHNKRDSSGRDMGLIHRDVSPQNVLISYDGEVKLIDFGIAKTTTLSATPTETGTIKGKVGYMSPEQVRGLPIDRRSDVFACGVILYELLTGERLFVGESDFATLEKVRNAEVLPPTAYNPKIPDELERIVLKALSRDVDDRYRSAIDLHDELQAFVYTAAAFCSRKDLAAWMRTQFAEEVATETAKLEAFQRAPAPASSSSAALPASRAAGGTVPPPPRRTSTAPPPVPRSVRVSEPPTKVEGQRPLPPVSGSRPSQQLTVAEEPPVASARAKSPSAAPRMTSPPMMAKAKPERVKSELAWDEEEKETQIYPTDMDRRNKTGSMMPPLAASQPSFNAPSDTLDSPTPVSSLPAPVFSSRGVPAPSRPRPSTGTPAASLTSPAFATRVALIANKNRQSMTYLMVAGGLLLGAVGVWAITRGGPALGSAEIQLTGGNVSSWYLDGIKQAGTLPANASGLSITRLAEGAHKVRVDPAPGYGANEVTFYVKEGETSKVAVSVPLIEAIGQFKSTPAGARVKVVSNGVAVDVGRTPIEGTLDPNKTVDVVFELDGYAPVTKRVAFSGARTEEVRAEFTEALAVNDLGDGAATAGLNAGAPSAAGATDAQPNATNTAVAIANPVDRASEPRSAANDNALANERAERRATLRRERRAAANAAGTDAKPAPNPGPDAGAGAEGTLNVSVKPPCEVLVNGTSRGSSPLRGLSLKAGRHKVTLVNNEYGIHETFVVEVNAGAAAILRKDFQDRIGK